MKIIKQDMSIWLNNGLVWIKNDKLHREDGPAIIWSDGQEYFRIKGEAYNNRGYWREIHENY